MIISKKHIDEVTFITLSNQKGLEVTLCSCGASIYDLKFIDSKGNLESIVLYPTNLEDFYTSTGHHGKSIGRFSGRIDKGMCEIGGKEYHLDINWNGISSLHGGFEGIGFKNFDYLIVEKDSSIDVVFTYLEKANQLPGDVSYKFTYEIMKESNNFTLFFEAETTEDTLVNLTNHVYFNLSGDAKKNILDHKLQLLCDKYTNLNNELITIAIEPVNEVMDFRKPHKIGDYIFDELIQNHTARGYDHCWIKENENNDLIAVMIDDDSKRMLKVSTSYPAIVCYAGCYPAEFPFNKDAITIEKHHSMCLECQYVPNGINMDGVEKAILKAGETYRHYIKYEFDLME